MKGIRGRVNSNYKELDAGVFLKCCRSSERCLPELRKNRLRGSQKKMKQNGKELME